MCRKSIKKASLMWQKKESRKKIEQERDNCSRHSGCQKEVAPEHLDLWVLKDIEWNKIVEENTVKVIILFPA